MRSGAPLGASWPLIVVLQSCESGSADSSRLGCELTVINSGVTVQGEDATEGNIERNGFGAAVENAARVNYVQNSVEAR